MQKPFAPLDPDDPQTTAEGSAYLMQLGATLDVINLGDDGFASHDEVVAARRFALAVGAICSRLPQLKPSWEPLAKRVLDRVGRFMLECQECQARFDPDPDGDDGGIPECPNCNSSDFEVN